MLEGISDSIKAALYDRLSNPLLSSFLISWSILNYEVFLYLFSDLSPINKIYGINAIFSDGSSLLTFNQELPGWFIYGVWHPLVFALIYLFIFPFPSEKVFKFWRETQKKLHEIKISIDDETPLTIEQSKKIKSENIDLRSKLEASNDSVSELRARIQELLTENEELKANSLISDLEQVDTEIEKDNGNYSSINETDIITDEVESNINDEGTESLREDGAVSEDYENAKIELHPYLKNENIKEFRGFSKNDIDRLLNYIYERDKRDKADIKNYLKTPKFITEELLNYLIEEDLLSFNVPQRNYRLTDLGVKRLKNSDIFD